MEKGFTKIETLTAHPCRRPEGEDTKKAARNAVSHPAAVQFKTTVCYLPYWDFDPPEGKTIHFFLLNDPVAHENALFRRRRSVGLCCYT